MSRLRVIIGGTALALLAAAVPIAVMAYATWDRAVSVEQQRLRDIAGRALRRADQSYQEALAALQSAEVGAHNACGPDHIRRMQTLVMTSPSVDQMGYFEGGKLRCTSWGRSCPTSTSPSPTTSPVMAPASPWMCAPRQADGARSCRSCTATTTCWSIRAASSMSSPTRTCALPWPARTAASWPGRTAWIRHCWRPCCARLVKAWTTTPCTPPPATKSGWRSRPHRVPRSPRPSASRRGCSCPSAFCWPLSVPAW